MKGGLLSVEHPMATGINPKPENQFGHQTLFFNLFVMKKLVMQVMTILSVMLEISMRKMVLASASTSEFPQGKPDRIRILAINYIDGCVHYNGGFSNL